MNRNIIRKAWILIGIIISLPLVSLSAGGDSDEEERPSLVVNSAGIFPIVDERVTMTAFIPTSSLVDDWQDNDFVRYLEEKTNVFLELETAPDGAEAMQKRNLLLASGDYPEIFITGFSKSEQQFYGSQGVFLPLNDLIAEYGVNTRKAFADYPLVEENMTMLDGTIYSLPDINDCFHCAYSQKMWIYQPWLDKLGLEMPATTEEFKDVLIAFRDRDPNGNGIQDEIPLSGAVSGYGTGVDGFIMNAFVYSHGNLAEGGASNNELAERGSRIFIKNGIITAAFAEPGWREGLRYMNDLYNERLLSGDAFIQDRSQYLQLGENPDVVLMGAGSAGHNGVFTQFYSESGRWLDYKVVPALEGPDGTRVSRYNPVYGVGEWTITDRAAYPEAAFRLGDAFYEPDLMLHSTYGREGIEWVWAQPGEIGINGRQAVWKALVGYGDGGRSSWWHQRGPQVRSRDFRLGEVRGDDSLLSVILYEETRDKMAPYKVDSEMLLPPLAFNEDVSVEIVDFESTLTNYVNEMIARFIIGDADINTEWDDYLAELDNIGLPRYIELIQEAYDKR